MPKTPGLKPLEREPLASADLGSEHAVSPGRTQEIQPDAQSDAQSPAISSSLGTSVEGPRYVTIDHAAVCCLSAGV